MYNTLAATLCMCNALVATLCAMLLLQPCVQCFCCNIACNALAATLRAMLLLQRCGRALALHAAFSDLFLGQLQWYRLRGISSVSQSKTTISPTTSFATKWEQCLLGFRNLLLMIIYSPTNRNFVRVKGLNLFGCAS